jgi:hypothetical protein
LTYSDYVAILQKLLTVPTIDNVFLSVIPRIIDYAEQRIYREGQFLATVVTDSTVALAASSRILPLPSDQRLYVVDDVNVITPAGTTNPDLGVRNTLTPTTKEWLNQVWNSAAGAALPQYVARLNDQTMIVGPWPDQAYQIEFVGTIRPTPLSAANPTTFLSLYLPDLFVAASMIFGTGCQRDFGAQSDDPQAAVSWERVYGELFASSNMEEAKKRWSIGAAMPPPPPAPQTAVQ